MLNFRIDSYVFVSTEVQAATWEEAYKSYCESPPDIAATTNTIGHSVECRFSDSMGDCVYGEDEETPLYESY
jgi:hypothetical protein